MIVAINASPSNMKGESEFTLAVIFFRNTPLDNSISMRGITCPKIGNRDFYREKLDPIAKYAEAHNLLNAKVMPVFQRNAKSGQSLALNTHGPLPIQPYRPALRSVG
ncbi:hypothetical protein [Mesorhizobium sangaii]|uniref:Uncharacterized protein n=1 Tax=Mesorhizobium sangaii TaxID=505389 RepID=A0A841PJ81_9HYPH|nr:hypothetical protein [Mesorhizobium sangaii]MBB6414051.1 hypothetical protein [Mesorhizobium sangaii]